MSGLRTSLLTLAAVFAAGCTSIYDEVCEDHDARQESIRARVLGGFTLPPGATVITCQSRPAYPEDEEACLLSIAPADFETTFSAARFGPDRPGTERRPYASTPQSLAQANGVSLDWLRYKSEFPSSAAVFSNQARDRVIVYSSHDRCHSASEVI